MARQLILINGIPAAGKTTLSRQLGSLLSVPVLSKDTLMTTFSDITEMTVPGTPLGALASETMWHRAGLVGGRAIVKSFWLRRRDLEYARAGLVTADQPNFVEVWCDVPPEAAWVRFRARKQHAIHPSGKDARERWGKWVENAEPLALGPVISVKTDQPVDVEDLMRQVLAELGPDVPATVGACT
ncbi:MAG: AAA family ATPase [Specibacter sp.]